jgi:RNA polymerase sigma factor (sigma-70 family)
MARVSVGDEVEALRLACLAGDADAWAAFQARFHEHVHHVIHGILSQRGLPSRRADVDEVVDDFFGDLCATRGESLGSFRGDGPFRAFLAVMAANHARRAAEAERRRRLRFGVPLDAVAHDPRLAVPGSATDDGDEVTLILALLPEGDRKLFRILYLEEMDPDAAAERLGVTRTALYIRKHRFLKRVRALLDERSGEPTPSSSRGKRESSQGHGTR